MHLRDDCRQSLGVEKAWHLRNSILVWRKRIYFMEEKWEVVQASDVRIVKGPERQVKELDIVANGSFIKGFYLPPSPSVLYFVQPFESTRQILIE